MPTWTRHLYEHNELAIAKGESTGYKTLFKFGFNPDINGTEETIWAQGGNYPWPDASFTAYVVSDAAADANGNTGANKIRVEGLDANYNEQSVEVELNGTSPVAVAGTWIRVNRAFVTLAGSGGTSAGTIHVQNVDGSVVYANLGLGNQTQIAAYTVPAGYTLYLDDINFTAALSQSNKFVTCNFVTKDFGSNVFRSRFINVIQSNQLITKFEYPQKLEEKTDMECRAVSNTTNNAVGASFQGVLIKNDPTGNV